MKKHRFIGLFFLIFTFSVNPQAVHADDFLTAPFKLLVKTIETRKENKEANKNVRNEIIEKQRNIQIQYLDEASKRMEGIATRIDSRIRKNESNGAVDLTKAREALKVAKNKIADAKEDTALFISPPSESVSKDLQIFIDTAVLNLNEARGALEKAMQSIDNGSAN